MSYVNYLSYGYFHYVCQKTVLNNDGSKIIEGKRVRKKLRVAINDDPADLVCGLLYQFLPVLSSAVASPQI
jgi:hypothetical protein